MSARPGLSYVGRFAPSPTGWLHAGSMVAALASWLDARAHGGRWLVRIEDVDGPRCIAGAEDAILRQLADCGLHPDAPPVRQSDRGALYAQALERLHAAGLAYGCRCTRREIAQALQARGLGRERHGDLVYPGTCRPGGPQPVPWPEARAVRLLTCADDGRDTVIDWTDRRLGAQRQNLSREVGDFVLRRADGLFAYQLAVVVDDAWQGITHVVRGADLLASTPRQIALQRSLGYPEPVYAHLPVAANPAGEKLSKQTLAQALRVDQASAELVAALRFLGQAVPGELSRASVAEVWAWARAHWSFAAVPRQALIVLPA